MRKWDRILLVAIARANGKSFAGHYSEGVIRRFYPKEIKEGGGTKLQRRLLRRAYTALKEKRLIIEHPTRGGNTWGLTKEGLKTALELIEEMLID